MRSITRPMTPTTRGASRIPSQTPPPRLATDEHGVGAEHQELALRQIQHAHHAEDDGEPERHQHQDRDGEQRRQSAVTATDPSALRAKDAAPRTSA